MIKVYFGIHHNSNTKLYFYIYRIWYIYCIWLFINHVKNPNHNKLIISSYSKYVDKPKKVIDFIEYNKNLLAKAGTLEKAALGLNNSPDPMVKIMAELMIYNILTTKPADVLH